MGSAGSGKQQTLHGADGLLTRCVEELLHHTTPFLDAPAEEARTFLRVSAYMINQDSIYDLLV